MEPNSWFLQQLKLISPILGVRFVPCRGRVREGKLYHGERYHNPSPFDPYAISIRSWCERSPISQRYLCGGGTDPANKKGRWIIERKVEDGAQCRFGLSRFVNRLEMVVETRGGGFRYPDAQTLASIRRLHMNGLVKHRRDAEARNERVMAEIEVNRRLVEGSKWARFEDIKKQAIRDATKHFLSPLVGPSGRPVMPGADVFGRPL